MARKRLIFALLVALAAFAVNLIPSTPLHTPSVSGKNNTILFLTNPEYGASNVHLATAATLARMPQQDLEIHWGSFPPMKKKLDKMMAHVTKEAPGAKEIIWHELKGTTYTEGMDRAWVANGRINSLNPMTHAPGYKDSARVAQLLSIGIAPWTTEEVWDVYQQSLALIEEVDPAVIVLDFVLVGAFDAVRALDRVYAVVSPNDLVTTFVDKQPKGGMFWKYPSWGSGLDFPIPWRQIPLNIYLRIRAIVSIATSPLWKTRSTLLERGVANPMSSLGGAFLDDSPWIVMSMPEAGMPIDLIPDRVKECGPIVLNMDSTESQSPELASWAKRAPTVLINLGTVFKYDPASLLAMVQALDVVLEKTDVQVLWKVREEGLKFEDETWKEIVDKWTKAGRLRIVGWLDVEPLSLLLTGDVVLSVHHGGASSYFETVFAGVPHMVLPQWIDTYSYATTTEYCGLGIWASKETSPAWDSQMLVDGFLTMLVGEEGKKIRSKAKAVGEISRGYGGSRCAADIVADLAGKGK